MTVGGDAAFARDYKAGKWDCEDIAVLVDFAFRNDKALGGLVGGSQIKRSLFWLAAQLQTQYVGGRVNIHAHYDLGNEFLLLVGSDDYSSAIFSGASDTLTQGQL